MADAPVDCQRCSRLAAFRADNRGQYPDFFNDPVPSFGPGDAALLIVGLAPGLKGANRTGRPFTGDYAGDLLYPTLTRFGFSRGAFAARADDGLRLVNCRITNAVRCVPPQNKPVGAEVKNCLEFLISEIQSETAPRVVLSLGAIAHGAVLSALALRKSLYSFGHGAVHRPFADPASPVLIDSYHCSRYNTNTGRVTEAMFHAVFEEITRLLADAP